MGKASDQVRAFKNKVHKRYRAIARTAVLETNNLAQVTVGEGGRLRVLTGFLRASNAGASGARPSGPTRGEKDKNYPVGSYVGEPVAVALLGWDPISQEPFFVGWTANYARYREAHDGFMRGAVEMWPETVKKARKKVRAGGI